MLRFTSSYMWASCLACLAIAVAASGAFAEEEQDQAQQYQAQKPTSDDESQRQDQDRQRDQQQRAQQQQQRAQQQQQRAQQQRAQQSRLRDQQTRSGDQDRWNRSADPEQYDRDPQRSARGRNEGGLGVSITRDSRQGVTVTRIHRNSPADRMGLREGDRITRLNGQRIQSTREFISRIRNMDPGDQIELDVRRDRDQRIFRGRLDSREQALVLRGSAPRGQMWPQDGRGTRQTGYEEGGRFADGQLGRGGEVERQLSQIEQQLSQLSRAIEDLRYAVRDVRQQSARWGRETTAGYDEYQYRRPGQSRNQGTTRMNSRSQNEQPPFEGARGSELSPELDPGQRGQQPRQYDQGPRFDQNYEQGESRGGETGDQRLRPDRN